MADTLGEALAAPHALDPAPRRDVVGPESWQGFLADQYKTAVDRRRERKLPEPWLDQIPEFLDAVPLNRNPDPVLRCCTPR